MELLIGDVFRRNAAARPRAAAASLGGRVLHHGELDRAGNRLAHALAAQGLGRGDRVLGWSDTSLDVLQLFAGLAKLGAVFAPLNALYGVDEAGAVARYARARALVADPTHAEAAEAVARAAEIPLLFRSGGGAGPGLDLDALAGRAADGEPAPAGLRETDPHVIFFTSGSTGRPKGVLLSHRVSHLRSFQGVFRDRAERTVCMFPLFHMAGFGLALAAWQTGGEIALVPRADAGLLLEAVERRGANRLYCIPAVWSRVLATDLSRRDLASLREVDTGTSATPPELVSALKERFPGTATRIYYGSTECGPGAVLPDADVLRKPGSVGLAPPGVELRLDANGEVLVRSPYLMDGYFELAEATAEALRDGWYHSGDLGVLDDEGYLCIAGRLREVIRTGGESVAPTEVEAALAGLPGAAELAVVGVPDPEWGEVVCAVVVPGAGARPDLAALRRHCEGRLARFKVPRRLECVAALPRTAATGQVQRTLLVERLLARAEPAPPGPPPGAAGRRRPGGS